MSRALQWQAYPNAPADTERTLHESVWQELWRRRRARDCLCKQLWHSLSVTPTAHGQDQTNPFKVYWRYSWTRPASSTLWYIRSRFCQCICRVAGYCDEFASNSQQQCDPGRFRRRSQLCMLQIMFLNAIKPPDCSSAYSVVLHMQKWRVLVFL